MNRFFFALLSVLLIQGAFARPDLDQDQSMLEPPYQIGDIEGLARQILALKSKEFNILEGAVKLVLMDSEHWWDYANLEHHVSPEADGRDPGDIFPIPLEDDVVIPTDTLPVAEITETGEFYLWWKFYNVRHWSMDKVEEALTRTVTHELYHYLQWKRFLQKVAEEVMSTTIPDASLPNNLGEVQMYFGDKSYEVTERFLAIWRDPGHYQCREVEAYARIVSGMPTSTEDEIRKKAKRAKAYRDKAPRSF